MTGWVRRLPSVVSARAASNLPSGAIEMIQKLTICLVALTLCCTTIGCTGSTTSAPPNDTKKTGTSTPNATRTGPETPGGDVPVKPKGG